MLKEILEETLERHPNGRISRSEGSTTYDPSTEYYSVDWHSKKDIRWVRNTFVELEDLKWYGVSGLAKGESVFQTAENFRVLPEKWLSEPRQNWNEELNSYVPDVMTNRQFIFGDNYECCAIMATAQQSLGKYGEEETMEEWLNRIKEDPRMKEKFLKKGSEGGSKYCDGQYAHLSLVDGKWVSDKKEGVN